MPHPVYDFNYVDVKRVNQHSSFVSLEIGIVHYKNCIGLNDFINKRGQKGMWDKKNMLKTVIIDYVSAFLKIVSTFQR